MFTSFKYKLFFCFILFLTIGITVIVAKPDFKNKKDFYKWVKELREDGYTYTSTLNQKEYFVNDMAHLTNKVYKREYPVYNIPIKILITDAKDNLQKNQYRIIKHKDDLRAETNQTIQAENKELSNSFLSGTNIFTKKTSSFVVNDFSERITNDDNNLNQVKSKKQTEELIYYDSSLEFDVGKKTGNFNLYTFFLDPVQHYTQHIQKINYRVINKNHFYASFILPYFFIILLFGLSFFTPLKWLRKSPYFFVFNFLSGKITTVFSLSYIWMALVMGVFVLIFTFYSLSFLFFVFTIFFLLSYFYKPLKDCLLSLLLIGAFVFFWKDYGDSLFFTQSILNNILLCISLNGLLLILSPFLSIALLLILIAHFSFLVSSYWIYFLGNILLIILAQIYFSRKSFPLKVKKNNS